MKKLKYLIILLMLFIPFVVNAKTNYLYDVIKEASEENAGAREYTGDHQDSIDSSRSTQKIYTYIPQNGSSISSTDLPEKTNVIFAGMCWRMIRTTDTGGVKMILVTGATNDNKCTAGKYPGGYSSFSNKTVTAGTSYYFGTAYLYNNETSKYMLSGEIESSEWNENTWSNLKGKYTCLSTTGVECTSEPLLIYDYNSNTSMKVLITGRNRYNSYKFNIGSVPYNEKSNSPAYLGYMYGDAYEINHTTIPKENNLSTVSNPISSTFAWRDNWYAADNANWNSSTGTWELVNPYRVSSVDDYDSLLGKYTFFNSSESASERTLKYIVLATSDKVFYLSKTGNSEIEHTFRYANSFTDNGNGTYSLVNPQTLDYTEYLSNPAAYQKIYTCRNMQDTCENMKYQMVDVTSKTIGYKEISVQDKITLAKTRTGKQLSNTIQIPISELLKNYDNYSEYKYTCGTISTTCPGEEIRIIDSITDTGYNYSPLHYYGSSVTWDGEKYILQNTVEPENYKNADVLSTHHYYCEEPNQNTCNKVLFITRMSGLYHYYITLENGKNISDAMTEMLSNNKNESIAKFALEAWYKNFLSDYSDMIDEHIYCDDRTVSSYGGWSETGGLSEELVFSGRNQATLNNYSCDNISDQFSISNSQAKLKYSIGLITRKELYMTSFLDINCTNTSKPFYENTPLFFDTYSHISEFGLAVHSGSPIYCPISRWNNGVEVNRSDALLVPTIALKSNVEYLSGDGSKENPYIAGIINRYKVNVEIRNETKELDINIEDLTSVYEGEEVTFKVTPIKGFKVTNIEIVDEDDNNISYEETNNKNEYTFIMPANDVIIRPSYERVSNAVNIDDNPHTKEIKIEVNDASAVVYEDEVIFTVEPEDGYVVEKIEIIDADGNKIDYKKTNKENKYSFVMPDVDVTIIPTYKKLSNNIPNNPKTGASIISLIALILIFGISIIFVKRKSKLIRD